MTEAAQRMARGDYDVRVSASSQDEVGRLGRGVQPDGRGPGRRRPRAPGPGRDRLPRAADPARRPGRAPGEPRRRRRARRPRRRSARCWPRRSDSAAWSPTCSTCRASTPAWRRSCSRGSTSPLLVEEARADVALPGPRRDVRRPGRAGTERDRPTAPGCASSWSTCSTTPSGTARRRRPSRCRPSPVGAERLVARGARRGAGRARGRAGPGLRALRHARRASPAAAPGSASRSPAGWPSCTAAGSASSTATRTDPQSAARACASTSRSTHPSPPDPHLRWSRRSRSDRLEPRTQEPAMTTVTPPRPRPRR